MSDIINIEALTVALAIAEIIVNIEFVTTVLQIGGIIINIQVIAALFRIISGNPGTMIIY